jgi:mono/diheme cytochrome c family protein
MTTPELATRFATLVATAAVATLLSPALATAGDAAAGKPLFEANCSPCHGLGGKGDGVVGVTLPTHPRDFTKADFLYDTDGDGKKGTDADLKNIITHGAAAYGGSPLMAPWPMLTPQQIDNIIAYVRTFHQ